MPYISASNVRSDQKMNTLIRLEASAKFLIEEAYKRINACIENNTETRIDMTVILSQDTIQQMLDFGAFMEHQGFSVIIGNYHLSVYDAIQLIMRGRETMIHETSLTVMWVETV